MLLRRNPIVIKLTEPVGITVGVGPFLPNTWTIVYGSSCQCTFLISFDTFHHCRTENISTTTVGWSTVEILCKSIRIHQFRDSNSIIETHVSRVIDIGFTTFTAFRCYQDNTERSSGTVNRSRCSIFQYWYRFNVIRVYSIQISLNTINQHQRRRSGTITDSTCTTDIDVHFAVQRTTRVTYCQVQTRNNTLQCLRHVLHRTGSNNLGIHHSHGTGYIHFLLCTITHNHYFFQSLSIIFQSDIDRFSIPNDFLTDITYKWNNNNVPLLHIR